MKLYTQIKNKNPIQYLFSWNSKERYWKEKDKSWYVKYSFLFTVIVAFLALLGEWVLITAVVGFAFLWFIQGSVEPPVIEHVISTIGIKTYGRLYKWKDIKFFWFSEKNSVINLNLDIISSENPESTFKRRLSLIIDPQDKELIFFTLFDYIEYGRPQEVGINLFTQLIFGKYTDIEEFMEKQQQEIELMELKMIEESKKYAIQDANIVTEISDSKKD